LAFAFPLFLLLRFSEARDKTCAEFYYAKEISQEDAGNFDYYFTAANVISTKECAAFCAERRFCRSALYDQTMKACAISYEYTENCRNQRTRFTEDNPIITNQTLLITCIGKCTEHREYEIRRAASARVNIITGEPHDGFLPPIIKRREQSFLHESVNALGKKERPAIVVGDAHDRNSTSVESANGEDGFVNTLIVSNLTGIRPSASSDVRRADPKRARGDPPVCFRTKKRRYLLGGAFRYVPHSTIDHCRCLCANSWKDSARCESLNYYTSGMCVLNTGSHKGRFDLIDDASATYQYVACDVSMLIGIANIVCDNTESELPPKPMQQVFSKVWKGIIAEESKETASVEVTTQSPDREGKRIESTTTAALTTTAATTTTTTAAAETTTVEITERTTQKEEVTEDDDLAELRKKLEEVEKEISEEEKREKELKNKEEELRRIGERNRKLEEQRKRKEDEDKKKREKEEKREEEEEKKRVEEIEKKRKEVEKKEEEEEKRRVEVIEKKEEEEEKRRVEETEKKREKEKKDREEKERRENEEKEKAEKKRVEEETKSNEISEEEEEEEKKERKKERRDKKKERDEVEETTEATRTEASSRPSKKEKCFEELFDYVMTSTAGGLEHDVSMDECKCLCANSVTSGRYAFQCRSATYYHNERDCVLNVESRRQRPELLERHYRKTYNVTYLGLQCTIMKAVMDLVNPDLEAGCIQPFATTKAPPTTTTTERPATLPIARADTGTDSCFLELPHFVLEGTAQAVETEVSVEECKCKCADAERKYGEACQSAQYFPEDRICLLNKKNRFSNPESFNYVPLSPQSYFESKCVSKEDTRTHYLESKCAAYVKVERRKLKEDESPEKLDTPEELKERKKTGKR
ncbi:hypothetical protein PENTCL1PPCAC_27717, partial [Pristionchus entomophagus]